MRTFIETFYLNVSHPFSYPFHTIDNFCFVDFLIAFLFSISFISALLRIISFLLLTLGLAYSSFSSFISCKIVYLIYNFFWFFNVSKLITIIFPLSTIFTAFHKWHAVLSFWFVSVLVSLGCCNRKSLTGWLKQKKLFSHSFGGGSSTCRAGIW